MDSLGSGILLDPITGTRLAGPSGVRSWRQRQRGRSRWGGRNPLPSPSKEAGRRGDGAGGGGGEVTWGVARTLRAAPDQSPRPLFLWGGEFGGRGVKMAAGR